MPWINQVRVTLENLEEARKVCRDVDQAANLEDGAITWGITCDNGRLGQMTRWPSGRGAVSFGDFSRWGNWFDGDSGPILRVQSCPCVEVFDIYGERVSS